jgi:RNA polymerase sigma-70 factor (ECF subfamily)
MLHDREEAEDVVQEAALKAWSKLETLREAASMKPWFLAIVANQCRTVRRGRWWSVLKLADPGSLPDVSEDRLAGGEDLRRALRRLDYSRRLVIVLHFYLDLPFEEVAATLGVSEEAVKSRISRAVRDLRLRLGVRDLVR